MIYDILYKTLIGSKSLHHRFDKIIRFITIYDGTRRLVLSASRKYDTIYNRIRYFISQKNSIAYFLSHYYAKIKVDSYDFLPIEKILALHNVIILVKSVLNKEQFHYYYNIFLEKRSIQLAKK